MTARFTPEGGNGVEHLEIGLDDQRKGDQVASVMRSTRRQLLIFVGGTGLEVLAAMAQILKERGIKFGDETIAAHKPIVPHAMFVDADIQAIKAVQGDTGFEEETDERKRYRLQIEQLREMGVQVCNIFSMGRQDFLTRSGLGNDLTPGMPSEEDPQGCKADPRVGYTRYLYLRDRPFDDNNPRKVAASIVDRWLSTQTAFLAEETLLTIVGGLHGGTGQIALPIMADVRKDIEKTLRGSKTTLETERYAMTSQSAGIDSSRRSDGLQRKRMLNTASGVVLANAAAVQRGFQMMPTEWVDGVPVKFTFVVNGANPHKQVSNDGGHYVPATVIAKHLVARILGLDLTATGRSNARLEINETKGSSRTPNTPRALFSALGVSELLPCPERAKLTMQKKHVLFTQIVGLGNANAAASADKLKVTFPNNLLESTLQDAVAPQLLATQFGEGEDAKLNIETERDRFVGELETNLRPEVRRALRAKAQQMNTDIFKEAGGLKQSHGLATLMHFLQTALEQLGQLEAAAKRMLDDTCSRDALDNLAEEGRIAVKKVKAQKIGSFDVPLFYAWRTKSLERLNDLLTDAASTYSAFAQRKRDNMCLSELQAFLINPLRKVISSLLDNAKLEEAQARTMLDAVKPDPVEMSLQTSFDVEVPVHMELHEDSLQMRTAHLGNGNWTQEKLQLLLNSLAVNAADIKLFEKLNQDTLVTLERLSSPLTRPASGQGHNAATTISTVSLPVDTAAQAAGIPVPPNATRLPIGPDGPLMVTQEFHGINALLDDAYVRECLELLLATPPTEEEAHLVQTANPHDPELRLKLNRESQFTFDGQAARLLPAVFRALAERQYGDNGRRGEVVEKCPGSHCGVPFYLSPEEKRAKVTCCPGCRRLPKAAPTVVVKRTNLAAADKKTAGKGRGK